MMDKIPIEVVYYYARQLNIRFEIDSSIDRAIFGSKTILLSTIPSQEMGWHILYAIIKEWNELKK